MTNLFLATFGMLAVFGLIALSLYGTNEMGWTSEDLYGAPFKLNTLLVSRTTDQCKLPQYNPWDEAFVKYFDPLFGYQRQCQSNSELRTTLVKGILTPKSKNDSCWGRCLYWKDDWAYKEGEWSNSTKPFDCDVIEAICATNGILAKYDYWWLHTQIYERDDIKKKKSVPKNHTYDILIIILDSTSATQSYRNLGKTVTYLTKGLNGFAFPYLNRVGMNTKPNLFSLFYGAIPERVDRSMFNEPSIEAVLSPGTLCHTSLDNLTSMHSEFEKAGYVTSHNEEWAYGWSNYPNCVGTKKKFATHVNNPFRIAWKGKEKTTIINNQNYCASKHQLVFDHAGQFLNSYKGKPKFLTLIDTNLGHYHFSSSLEADTMMYDFFIKNRKFLENSFIFLMGDHGLRFGQVSSTKLVIVEQNNPMLYVVPPANLVKYKELMKMLKVNSLKIQTHLDVRETIMDILKFQPSGNFSERTPKVSNNHGSSFLREQNGERSCRTLPIPFQYCMCDYPQEKQDLNSLFARRIGALVTDNVNQIIADGKLTEKCERWTFEKVSMLTKINPVDFLDAYHVQVVAKPKAIFKTMVIDYRNGTWSVGKVDRADMYKNRGDCVEETYRRLCECKKK